MSDDRTSKPILKDLTAAGMKAALRRGSRLLGLDLGTRTIGLATSDRLRIVATPLRTIRRTKFAQDARELQTIVDRHDVGGLVIGLPVEMDGSEGRRCQSTRQFAASLAGLTQLGVSVLPVAFWDERLSTAAVTRMMIEEMDITRKRRAKAVDKAAAGFILQGFLDAMSAA